MQHFFVGKFRFAFGQLLAENGIECGVLNDRLIYLFTLVGGGGSEVDLCVQLVHVHTHRDIHGEW